MKKIFTRESKIGIAFLIGLSMLIIGVNFLKGINLFTPSNYFYATYESLDGLVVSNGVMVKGYKVGQVTNISYDLSKEHPFIVEIRVNKDVRLPKGTILTMQDDGLMGGKIINLDMTNNTSFYQSGDTVPSQKRGGLFDELAGIIPKLNQTFDQVDSVLASVNALTSSPELRNSLKSVEGITADLKVSSANLKVLMNKDLPLILSDVNTITSDLKQVTGDLKKTDFVALFEQVDHTLANLNNFTDNLNQPDNSIGLLTNDRALYDQLNSTVQSANNLLIDLQANPRRYVHFSLFGGNKKSEGK